MNISRIIRSASIALFKNCKHYGSFKFNNAYHLRSFIPLASGDFFSHKINHLCIPVSSVHTKGDKELLEFLDGEIEAERKSRDNSKSKVETIKGFDIHTKEAEVTLSKNFKDEHIIIRLNVNDSVNTDVESDITPDINKPDDCEMKCKPHFEVEIRRQAQVMSFHCSFNTDVVTKNSEQEEYSDIFTIDELAFHSGEIEDYTYTVSGDILDGYLYDLLMNYLEERGISNQFAGNLIDFCTTYEHQLYINLLQNIQTFLGH